jgi:hypothetical protein
MRTFSFRFLAFVTASKRVGSEKETSLRVAIFRAVDGVEQGLRRIIRQNNQ